MADKSNDRATTECTECTKKVSLDDVYWCDDCGATICKECFFDDDLECASCSDNLCSDCELKCKKCGRRVCTDCIDHITRICMDCYEYANEKKLEELEHNDYMKKLLHGDKKPNLNPLDPDSKYVAQPAENQLSIFGRTVWDEFKELTQKK